MESQELRDILALSQLPGIGNVWGRRLITAFKTAGEVFRSWEMLLPKYEKIAWIIRDGVGDRELWRRTDEEMRFIEKYRLRVLFFTDEAYPGRLKDCNDAPVYLFYKGTADLNSEKIVGIVGTRSATEYGKGFTRDLINDLKSERPLILSGLAYGIDSCAHRTALECGLETIAVLGHGLDRIYPQNNETLARKMSGQGGLVTEFFSKTLPDRENFPQRNRLIAGMVDALIVVEAADKGGALITADIASSYQRPVYAVPGRVTDKYSAGCNMMLKIKKAEVIRNAEDLKLDLQWKEKENPPALHVPKLFIQLTRDEEIIVSMLRDEGELSVDEIARKSGLPAGNTAAALLNLELEKVIKCKPGKIFQVS